MILFYDLVGNEGSWESYHFAFIIDEVCGYCLLFI